MYSEIQISWLRGDKLESDSVMGGISTACDI